MRGPPPILSLLTVGLCACGGDVAGEMERALRLGNDAIAFGLFASEGVAWVDSKDSGSRVVRSVTHGVADSAPGARHGIPTQCPKLQRDPDEGEPFTVSAAYGSSGCVSGSGLVPATLLGWIYVSGDSDTITVDATDVQIGLVRKPSGLLTGTRDNSTERYSMSGDLELPETNDRAPITGDIHLAIDHSIPSQVTLDGHVALDTDLGAERVALDNVVIAIEDISGECPLPFRGHARVGDSPELSIDFRGANDDGRVSVTRGRRTSTPTRLCSFASDVF